MPCQGAALPRVFSCIAVGFQPLWWVCNHLPGRTGVKSEFTDALAQEKFKKNAACKMRAFGVVLTLMNNNLCKFGGVRRSRLGDRGYGPGPENGRQGVLPPGGGGGWGGD